MLQKRKTAATTRKKCLTTKKWLTKTLCEDFILSPGVGTPPYLGYTGTCRWTGFGLLACTKQGIQLFDLPLPFTGSESVLNRQGMVL